MAKNKNYKGFKKDRRRRKAEQERRQQEKFEDLIKRNPVHHKVNALVIDDIFLSGKRKVERGHPCYNLQKEIEGLKRDHPYRVALHKVFRAVARRSKTLLEETVFKGTKLDLALSYLCKQHELWLQGPDTWRPKSRNTDKRFGSLARHLMGKYKVPEFLDTVYEDPGTWKDLFPYVAQGGNIRKYPALAERVQLTKRATHILMSTPPSYNFVQGVRRAQVLSLGGSKHLADAIANCHHFRELNNPASEEFWATVFQWFVNNPMIAPDQVSPMVDYIDNQRQNWDGNGPYLIRGRSAARMFADMQEWHQALRQARRYTYGHSYYDGPFEPCGLQEDIWETKGGKQKIIWTMEELLHSRALAAEGAALHHCVYSYANSVKRGNCSIWSLRKNGEPQVTVQVSRDGSITQARGSCNKLPKDVEMLYIRQWADKNAVYWSSS